ncbi:hypothetical protein ACFOWM_01010 [Ferruginibacter yonginensis]|uniref:Uncharacterized protein n=1 Tax=Ferruginibacter yonginensis TaxID=1310416 RepID=A0ABV8QP18_9BACT
MHKLFLYRLLKFNKIAALLVAAFLILYAVFFYKKMDMLLFPYNNMFTQQLNQNYVVTTYMMKVNQKPILISNDWYSKKDFSEAALTSFSKWIRNNKQDYMYQFVQQKTNDSATTATYKNKLFVDAQAAETWPQWFAVYHHFKLQKNDTILIWQYNLRMDVSPVAIMDTAIIYKKIVQ